MKTNEDIVIVLDIGKGMSTTKTQEGILLLEPARKAVSILISQKILFSRGDRISFVLFGGKKTQNFLASDDEYQNIETICGLQEPDISLCRLIEDLQPGGQNADVIDALIVALDIIVRDYQANPKNAKNQKRLFLVTDASSPMNLDSFEIVINQMIKREVKLNIIGINFEEIDHENENKYKDIKPSLFSLEKRKNEKTLREIAQKVNGVVVPVNQAIEIMSELRGKSQSNQRINFKAALEIGKDIKIAVVGLTKTTEIKFPTMRKVSAVALSQENLSGGKGVKAEKIMTRIDKPDEEIAPDQRVKGYKYGKTLVPFSKTDEHKLNYKTFQVLTVLGFTASNNIPRSYYMGPIDCIISDPSQPQFSTAFAALVRSCVELDCVPIVRFSKTARTNPSLGALIPALKTSQGKAYECFYYTKLPFVEDLRFHHFANLIGENGKYHPSEEQEQVVDQLIEKLDLNNFYQDEEGNPVEALKPKQTFNPSLQRFYQCLQFRALNPGKPLPKIDPLVASYLHPDEDLFKVAEPELSNIEKVFPLQKTGKQLNQEKKTFWRDNFANIEVKLNSYVPDINKKRKIEGEFDFSLNSILLSGTNSISSMRPCEDYKEMLARRDIDLVDSANQQMSKRIFEIINDSVMSQLYPKALDCIYVLRKGCIQEEESYFFNSFMIQLRSAFQNQKRDDFWRLLGEKKITLIDETESEDSTYTKEEAIQFLKEEAKVKSDSFGVTKSAGDEELDDILAELE